MKRFLILILTSAVIMLILPVAALKDNIAKTVESTSSVDSGITESSVNTEPQQQSNDTITVFLSSQNQNVEMDMFEYVCGSVAAEMPLAYHEEALKSQAVTCYTNALRLKINTEKTNQADISDNTAIHQGYIDEAQRREKWGNDFEKYESKLKNVVNSVKNEAIYYNDQLIVAAFFAISCGKTENSENLWSENVPYLKSVESPGDCLSPQYATSVSFSLEEFISRMKTKETDFYIESLTNAITITEASPSGTVLKAQIGDKSYTGEEIRSIFSLRSPVFTVVLTENSVTFNVLGYGHGIGMSQYGADYFARQGYTYKEILTHYYTGVTIANSVGK